MKKKGIILLGLTAVLAAMLFIPSVQAFAVTALSVFRVGDAKTIQITVTDIEEMMGYMSDTEESDTTREESLAKFEEAHSGFEENKDHEPEYNTLADVAEFEGFEFSLPKELMDQTPELYSIDASTKTFTLDTALINEHLAESGLRPIDENYNGTEITVNTPPAIVAEYENLILFATQGVNVDAPDDVINGLWQNMLQMPFLTENLRSQLTAIDPQTRDIYLPVIQGFGRETSIGASTGYIYTLSDLTQLTATLPESMTSSDISSEMPESEHDFPDNASILIWTNDGILYCLVGGISDSELSSIARSIR